MDCFKQDDIKCLVDDIKNYITGGIWNMLIKDETWCSLLRLSIQDFYYYIQKWIIDNNWGNVWGKDINTIDVCMSLTTSTIDNSILLSKYFSEEVGLSSRGDRYELKRGEFEIEIGRQVYEIPAGREIKHVFFELNSNIDKAKFASWYNNIPFAFGGGGAGSGLYGNYGFGFGGYGQVFHLFPAFDVLLRSMNMGLNEKILKSELTFKITKGTDGKRLIHLFSVPDASTFRRVQGSKLIYEYYDVSGLNPEDKAICEQDCQKIYSPTQVDLPKMDYSRLNDWSKNFVRKWFTAMAMQSEGMARSRFKGKIANIGGADIELDYDTLIVDSKEMIADLKADIKEFLMDIRSDKIAERKANEVENNMKALNGIPLGIYAI